MTKTVIFSCIFCSDCRQKNGMVVYDHILKVHGEDALKQFMEKVRAKWLQEFDLELERASTIAVVGPKRSGKTAFIVREIFKKLADSEIDLVITNATLHGKDWPSLEAQLQDVEGWKAKVREYMEENFPETWKYETKKNWFSDPVRKKASREAIIQEEFKTIDWLARKINPRSIVTLKTEEITGANIKKIIAEKSAKLGLLDSQGKSQARVLVIFDEVSGLLDSRQAMNKDIQELTHFAMQQAHHHTQIIIADPSWENIEVRYRRHTSKIFRFLGRIEHGIMGAPAFTYRLEMQRDGDIVQREKGWKSISIFFFLPYFFLYDTYDTSIASRLEIVVEQERTEAQDESEWKAGKPCPICQKLCFYQYEFNRHVASHLKHPKESAPKEDEVAEKIKEYLSQHPEARPVDISRALGLPYNTVWNALERIRRKSETSFNKV